MPFQSLFQYFSKASTKKILVFIILGQFLLHLPLFSLAPMGQHTWRQVDGHAQARNYYEEGADFFHPRLDIRVGAEDQGIIYKEFPLIYWLIGQSYKLTGFQEVNARFGQFLAAILLLLGAFHLARELGADPTRQKWFLFFFAGAPYFFYYSISLLPDISGMGWFLWGLAFLLPYLRRKQQPLKLIFGIIFITLACLTKATWLFFGLVIAVLFIESYLRDRDSKILLIGICGGAVILATFYLQYQHQVHLAALAPWERANETVLAPGLNFPDDWRDTLNIIHHAIGTWFLQIYVNLAAVPMFFAGCWVAYKKRIYLKSENGRFWLAWFTSLFLFFIFFFINFHHDGGYYMTPALPLAAWISSYGVSVKWQQPNWRRVIIIFSCLLPFVMVYRMEARWNENKQVAIELLEQADEFAQFIPKDDQILVQGEHDYVVHLYFIRRKGTPIPMNLSQEKLEYYKNKGISWLVFFTEDEGEPQLKDSLIFQGAVGRFQIYRF